MCLSSFLQNSFLGLSTINFFIWNADSASQVDDITGFLLVLLTKCYLGKKILRQGVEQEILDDFIIKEGCIVPNLL